MESTIYNTLVKRWKQQSISELMLRIYVKKGVITKEQFKEISGLDY